MHSSIYTKTRRLLNNPFTKTGVGALLLLTLIYSFNLVRYSKVGSPSRSGWALGYPRISGETGHTGEGLASLKTQPVVGKVHAVFGEPNAVYERALRLHETHSELMGHPMFVLRERLLSGLWSKPAFILSIMLQELARPEDQRLQWLFWIDADIVILNPTIPLDVFIPPNPEFDYVNMLVTHDRHGLNNGCFLIRVNPWAVKLLSAVIAFHTFKPEVELKYSEQSALEEMIKDGYWHKSVVHVPQYWFNAYPPKQETTTPRVHEFRPGGLQIHFAGNRDGKRPERMEAWMDIAEQDIAPYNTPFEQTDLKVDIEKFWADLSEERLNKEMTPTKELE